MKAIPSTRSAQPRGRLRERQPSEGSFSWRVLAGAMAGCAVLAAVVGILGGRTAIRAAHQWRPAAD